MVGFTVAFKDPEMAVHYKEMFYFILRSDGFKMDVRKGIKDEN